VGIDSGRRCAPARSDSLSLSLSLSLTRATRYALRSFASRAWMGFMDRHSIVPVSSQGTYGPVADIKCIVFAVKGVPAIPAVVVVLDQSRRVEQRKVAACLDRVLGSGVSVKRQDVVMLGVHWTRPACRQDARTS